jgi:hypothetical protein
VGHNQSFKRTAPPPLNSSVRRQRIAILKRANALKQTTDAILDDFFTIGSPRVGALLSNDADPEFIRGVQAAILSVEMGISLSYAEKRYVPPASPIVLPKRYVRFQSAYRAAVDHVSRTIQKWRQRPDEAQICDTGGIVFSNVALRRLKGAFRAAGFLFRSGYMLEARAVARTILEQVAWSYAVRNFVDYAQASKLSPTRCISDLKILLPFVGRLYGDLSEETHLGLEMHGRFLRVEGNSSKVLLCHGEDSWESGLILLDLADIWAIVFECSQRAFVLQPECWLETINGLELNKDRPMVKIIENHYADIDVIAELPGNLSDDLDA